MRLVVFLVFAMVSSAGCIAKREEAAQEETASAETPAAPAPASTEAPSEPVEPEPAVILWNLSGELSVGYVVAVGSFQQTVGTTDDQHCAHASFVVPEGTRNITLRLDGEIVDPARPSGGSQYLWVTPPEGEAFQLDPIVFESNPLDPPPGERTIEAPAQGEWIARVEAVGPVIGQSWSFTLALDGASQVPPSGLDPLITCTDS